MSVRRLIITGALVFSVGLSCLIIGIANTAVAAFSPIITAYLMLKLEEKFNTINLFPFAYCTMLAGSLTFAGVMMIPALIVWTCIDFYAVHSWLGEHE